MHLYLWDIRIFIYWVYHDNFIKRKYFPRYRPFVRGIHRSPVNSLHKGQWRGALMFSLIYARINGWANNGKAGDLRRHLAHYDVIVMICILWDWYEFGWEIWEVPARLLIWFKAMGLRDIRTIIDSHTIMTHLFRTCRLFPNPKPIEDSQNAHKEVLPYSYRERNEHPSHSPLMTLRHDIASLLGTLWRFQYCSERSGYCSLEKCCLSCLG